MPRNTYGCFVMQLVTGAISVFLFLGPALSEAQTFEPAACANTRATLDANKQLLLDFFAFSGSPEQRAERFLTDDYIQHNPRLLRIDEITGATGREAWLRAVQESKRNGIELVGLNEIQFGRPIILMAECDLVTAIYKGTRQDPDRPERSYELFAFETFRVRDRKFSEHWDQVTLAPGWLPHTGNSGTPSRKDEPSAKP